MFVIPDRAVRQHATCVGHPCVIPAVCLHFHLRLVAMSDNVDILLHDLRQPLDLEQYQYLLLLWRGVPPDVPTFHLCSKLAAMLREKFKELAITSRQVHNLLAGMLQMRPLKQMLETGRADLEGSLSEHQIGCCAAPKMDYCFLCSSKRPLQQHVRATPAFFYRYGAGPVRGCSVYKSCIGCKAEFHLHAYVPAGGGVKVPYPADKDNEEWEEVSSETYIHSSLLRRFEANLYFDHTTFLNFCKQENYVVDASECTAAGQTRLHVACGAAAMCLFLQSAWCCRLSDSIDMQISPM
jgi:hypothetical protein